MTVEHNFINLLRQNFHRVDEKTFRSSQPTPGQIEERVRRYGIKTVLNLRGFAKNSPLLELEQEACDRAGVKLKHFKITSRSIPTAEKLREAKALFEELEYPLMLHCKAGADRAGLMSSLYLHFHKGVPVEELDQLRLWPYGHIKDAKTGLLDLFFDSYIEYRKRGGEKDIISWLEEDVDRAQLAASFKPSLFTNILVEKILNRE